MDVVRTTRPRRGFAVPVPALLMAALVLGPVPFPGSSAPAAGLRFGPAEVLLDGRRAPPASAEVCGLRLIESDWRMQDGIGTPRRPSGYLAATWRVLRRGHSLIRHLDANRVPLGDAPRRWQALWARWTELAADPQTEQRAWERLWREVHRLRRRIALENPLAPLDPILFVKQVPGILSHQNAQYLGRYARPGGGVFVLPRPGTSMECRDVIADRLPTGSYQTPDVSPDGQRVLFAFCPVDRAPRDWDEHGDCHFHLYEAPVEGGAIRQLTDGNEDDFSPKYLPDGRILFLSTRSPGYSRCGPGIAPAHNLMVAQPDGSGLRLISFHETHEWDPAVLNDGRIVYTRWDYVDRDAAHYQHLWVTRPDGTNPSAYYGNMTLNPMGIWEARAVPGSRKVMATAAAHHAMTAGSILLVDPARATDGLAGLTRLTPDVPFPESEAPVEPSWHAPVADSLPAFSRPYDRWPGQCYRSPYPLSEDFFLAAYSFVGLRGEEEANAANMFGIYLVDRFGNRELLYRDLNISSLWPVPLKARPRRPVLPEPPPALRPDGSPVQATGVFFLQDVYAAQPRLPPGRISRLRVLQVVPKTTPREGAYPVGIPRAAPGKNVLGTVPVEADGSACFGAPAGVPLAFQALDDQGQAVQIMRSLTYLQPGERVSCIGCHEHRQLAPPAGPRAVALNRPPSEIQPGPPGSNPLYYPLLVQPVLDRHCLRCHRPERPEGNVVLAGDPQGAFTVSYSALVPLVSAAYWGNWASEPLTRPGVFGARGSRLMKLLSENHGGIHLSDSEWERLITWMDANALFYGTFDPAGQARLRRGQPVAGGPPSDRDLPRSDG